MDPSPIRRARFPRLLRVLAPVLAVVLLGGTFASSSTSAWAAGSR